MRYPLVKTPPRPLAAVRVGASDDARWRALDKSVTRIDRARAHETRNAARRPRP